MSGTESEKPARQTSDDGIETAASICESYVARFVEMLGLPPGAEQADRMNELLVAHQAVHLLGRALERMLAVRMSVEDRSLLALYLRKRARSYLKERFPYELVDIADQARKAS